MSVDPRPRGVRVRARDAGDAPADRVTLAYDDRLLRRRALSTDGGLVFLLDLPQATELPDGGVIELDDGRTIAVVAAEEPLLDIAADDRRHLLRLAWHLGNRHLPTEIHADGLRVRQDHVIEALVRHLGGRVTAVSAPFRPEGGAYGTGRAMGHDHSHSHNHEAQDADAS